MPVKTPPNESFYVHLQDARQDQLPLCVRAYRPQFNARILENRHRRADERKKQIMKQRVDRLCKGVDQVATLSNDCHEREYLKMLMMQAHIYQDMQAHQQRYNNNMKQRLANLRAHNEQVQKRFEMLRYVRYLSYIARQHDEKRKRKGIF
ncbi:GH21803 [Drosophila grimshawi]|uniref:GH21803 n=1 Tax=Drosophila grimshawi TaxID=7222 RepID=B4J773_DROGR|nr:GH21803 [Drosophila grimshawi]